MTDLSNPLRDDYYGGSIAAFGPFCQRFLDAGYSFDEIRDQLWLNQSRLSVGTAEGAAEKGREVLAEVARIDSDARELTELMGDAVWTDEGTQRRWRIVCLQARDVIDYRELAQGQDKEFLPTHVVAYGLIHRRSLYLRILFSATNAGVVVMRTGHKTNLQTETVLQAARWVRYLQAEAYGANAWQDRPLNHRFSTDDSRRDRLVLERQRANDTYRDLYVSLWLGSDRQDTTNGLFQLMDSIRGSESQQAGEKTVKLMHEKAVTHVLAGEFRAPQQEALLPPVIRHRADEDAIDGRARGGGSKGAGSLLGEWDLAVIPAVQDYVAARVAGKDADELALILRLHRVPTTPEGNAGKRRSSGRRLATFDQLSWDAAVNRAQRWLTLPHAGKIEPLPSPDDPKQPYVKALNTWRDSKLELLRSGRWATKVGVPKTLPAGWEFGGLPIHRASATDHGWVLAEQQLPWPEQRKLEPEPRECEVPPGIFLDAVETPEGRLVVSRTVNVLSNEVVLDDKGIPLPWTRLGLDAAALEGLMQSLSQPAINQGGRDHKPPADGQEPARALGSIPDWEGIGPDGQPVVYRMWPRGSYGYKSVTRWLVWRRPTEKWQTVTRGLQRADNTHHGVDYSDRHAATISEGALLRDVARAAVTAIPSELRDRTLEMSVASPSPSAERQRRAALEEALDVAQAELALLEARANGYNDEVADARAQDMDAERLQRLRDRRDEAERRCDEARNKVKAVAKDLERLDTDRKQRVDRHTDLTRVAGFVALLGRLGAHFEEGGGNGIATAALQRLIAPRFESWRVQPSGGGVSWTCRLRLDTTDGKPYEIPLAGHVSRGASDDAAEYVRRLLADGESWTSVSASLPRDTTLNTFRQTRMNPVLRTLGISSSAMRAFIDHPHGVLRQAFWAQHHNQHPSNIAYTLGFAKWVHDRWLGRSWSNSAVPKDVTDVHIIAGCLAQHPATGVELGELMRKTGISRTAITNMITPPIGGKGHVRPPAFFRWVATGIVGLHKCPPDQGCDNPEAYASTVAYFPETYLGWNDPRNPTGIGGVLCPSCQRIPHPIAKDAVFPSEYLKPYVGTPGRTGTLGRGGSMTRPVPELIIPKVEGPSGVTLSELERQFDISRALAETLLREAGVAEREMRRGGTRRFRTFDPSAPDVIRKALEDDASLDPAAYSEDAITIRQATLFTGVSADMIETATARGELTVHRNRRGHRKWLRADLLAWQDQR